MKTLAYAFLILSLAACSKRSGLKTIQYDEVEYYSVDISEEEAIENFYKKSSNAHIWEVFNGTRPDKLNDAIFTEVLKSTYDKRIVEKERFSAITSSFEYFVPLERVSSACDPFYRDIFVFKRRHKTVGIVKICKECRKTQLIGFQLGSNKYDTYVDLKKLFMAVGEKPTVKLTE